MHVEKRREAGPSGGTTLRPPVALPEKLVQGAQTVLNWKLLSALLTSRTTAIFAVNRWPVGRPTGSIQFVRRMRDADQDDNDFDPRLSSRNARREHLANVMMDACREHVWESTSSLDLKVDEFEQFFSSALVDSNRALRF